MLMHLLVNGRGTLPFNIRKAGGFLIFVRYEVCSHIFSYFYFIVETLVDEF